MTCHYEQFDGEKSAKALPATVECMDPEKVGVRRIGVRFVDDNVLQWVPQDWLSATWKTGELLSDNQMHQAPFPTESRAKISSPRAVEGAVQSHSGG